MMHLVRAAASRIAAISLPLLVVYALYAWVAEPLLARRADARDSIETQQMLLGRLQGSPALRAARAGGEPAQPSVPPERIFLPGESDTIRAAGLQSAVRDQAAAAGIRLQSAHAVEPAHEGPIDLIGVEVLFQASLPELQRLLFDLERAEPYLFVESLRVAKAPDSAVRTGKDLDVRLVVAGASPRTDAR